MWTWIFGVFGVLVIGVFALLWVMAGSPRDAYYMVRYAFPKMHRSQLKTGDPAPDVRLVALDGTGHFHIRERTVGRPLVLIFGSYT